MANPPSLTVGTQFPATVVVTGLHGAPTIGVSDPLYLDLSAPVVNGSSVTFTVKEVAGGHTSIVVHDPAGASVTIPVSGPACYPPQRLVQLWDEIIMPPSTYSQIEFVLASDPLFRGMTVRFLGSDGTIFETLTGRDPFATSRAPRQPPPGMMAAFAAVQLPVGVQYRVQIVDVPCSPPQVIGTFNS